MNSMNSVFSSYSLRLKSLLDKGAIGVLLLRDGSEVLFMGNDSYKPLLQSLSSVITWVENKIREEYLNKASAQYGTDLNFGGINVFSTCFSMVGAKVAIATYGSLAICCAFSGNEFSVNDLFEILRDLANIEETSDINLSKNILGNIKTLILRARKNVSMGDKEALLQDLADIRELLERLQDSSFRAYSEFLKKLTISLERTELTDELELRLKRTLLLLLKSISKKLEIT